MVAGKPLLQHTAEAANAARRLDRVILSTEDEEIAAVGRACGLDVPFMRPEKLARDDTPTLPVVLHALDWLEARGETYDAVCLLQPTCPLRTAEDIDGAVAMLEETGADSVISFVRVGDGHPARMRSIDAEGRVSTPPFAEGYEAMRRQDLAPLYLREGSIYLTRCAVLRDQRSFQGQDSRAWLVPPDRALNVDTPRDLLVAELVLLSMKTDR